MKLILCLYLMLLSTVVFANESDSDSEINKKVELPQVVTLDMLEDKLPIFRNLWTSQVTLFNGSKIYKQDDLFTLDGIQYVQVEFDKAYSKLDGMAVYDAEKKLNNIGVLTNKIRLMIGVPPISDYDNNPVLLCRINHEVKDTFYEMSHEQFNLVMKAFPSDMSIGQHCASLGTSRAYWKSRLNDF